MSQPVHEADYLWEQVERATSRDRKLAKRRRDTTVMMLCMAFVLISVVTGLVRTVCAEMDERAKVVAVESRARETSRRGTFTAGSIVPHYDQPKHLSGSTEALDAEMADAGIVHRGRHYLVGMAADSQCFCETVDPRGVCALYEAGAGRFEVLVDPPDATVHWMCVRP